MLGLLNIGLFFALLLLGAYRLPGGVAALAGAVQPLVVAGLAAGLVGERLLTLSPTAPGGGVLVGVALLVLRAEARLDPLGVAAALGAAVSMAAGVVLTKRWGRPASLVATTGWQLVAAACSAAGRRARRRGAAGDVDDQRARLPVPRWGGHGAGLPAVVPGCTRCLRPR